MKWLSRVAPRLQQMQPMKAIARLLFKKSALFCTSTGLNNIGSMSQGFDVFTAVKFTAVKFTFPKYHERQC
jgi:hypothetical protein